MKARTLFFLSQMNNKEIEVTYLPIANDKDESCSECFYRIDVALKPGISTITQLISTYNLPFVTVTIMGNEFPCYAWISSIYGSVIRINARTESPTQCTGTLFVRIVDGTVANVHPKKN